MHYDQFDPIKMTINRTSVQIISYTVLVILVTVTLIMLLGDNMLRTLITNSSVMPILLSMLGSVLTTVIFAVGLFYWSNRREREHRLPSRTEQAKDEVHHLEQQVSEIEKQRTDLEKRQQMLIWQMEAAVLAKQDPRLAVIIAYQGIEAELQYVLNRRYSQAISEELDKRGPRVFHNISLLEESIGPERVETIQQMRDLRNRIVHGEVRVEEASEDKAAEYVQRAIRLAGIISSLG